MALEYGVVLHNFRTLALTANWDGEEQVRSIFACIDTLVGDGDLPDDTQTKLLDVLAALALSELETRGYTNGLATTSG